MGGTYGLGLPILIRPTSITKPFPGSAASSPTSTVGFAVADEDQERPARLVEHFGLQAASAEPAAAAGQDYESLLADIRRAYKGGTPGR